MRRRRRLLRRLAVGVLLLVLVALVGGYVYARPLLLTGTGYAAHNACAVTEVAGRSAPETDLPPNPLVPYLRGGVDRAGGQASSSVLGALATQTAWRVDGYGCVLAAARPHFTAPPAVTTRHTLGEATAPTPSATVSAALDKAFGVGMSESDRTTLGTRAVVVLQRGQLVGERYAPGFDATTRQLGWSMSKSVASLMAGRLALQGRVALSDDHLRPEWSDQRSRITVEHLLRMTSGLAWNEDYDLGTPITEMLYAQPDMAGYVAGQPAAHAPGSYQQYSSGSTNLLCSVLRQRAVAGPELPWREIFQPLGLHSAVWEPDAVGTPVCSSYLWATPREWATLGQFALQDGVWSGQRLLPEGWMAQTTTVLPGAGEETGYAAGWWANRLPDGSLVKPNLPADTYWMQGHDGQRVYVVPSAQLVVVRLGFSPKVTDDRLGGTSLVADLVAALR